MVLGQLPPRLGAASAMVVTAHTLRKGRCGRTASRTAPSSTSRSKRPGAGRGRSCQKTFARANLDFPRRRPKSLFDDEVRLPGRFILAQRRSAGRHGASSSGEERRARLSAARACAASRVFGRARGSGSRLDRSIRISGRRLPVFFCPMPACVTSSGRHCVQQPFCASKTSARPGPHKLRPKLVLRFGDRHAPVSMPTVPAWAPAFAISFRRFSSITALSRALDKTLPAPTASAFRSEIPCRGARPAGARPGSNMIRAGPDFVARSGCEQHRNRARAASSFDTAAVLPHHAGASAKAAAARLGPSFPVRRHDMIEAPMAAPAVDVMSSSGICPKPCAVKRIGRIGNARAQPAGTAAAFENWCSSAALSERPGGAVWVNGL